jgi:hypothetical protein
MIKGLICPDGVKTPTHGCLNKCRMGLRCAPTSYIKAVATSDRKWSGIPSVTQLCNGTLESYLKIKHDYYVSPNDYAFAVNGTQVHANLEEHGENAEQRITQFGVSGQPDEVIWHEDDTFTLIDHKTAGSYKVAQCLGIATEKVETGEFFKNGKPKTKTEIVQIPGEWGDYELQLNMYRLMIEENTGKKCREMKIFFIVRDGGTAIAFSRGIRDNIYFSDVPWVEDLKVLAYFETKRDALIHAVENDIEPPICSKEERWFDRKCEKYCSVRELCKHSGVKNG